eukprot:SAG31_NODE_1886_length_6989_cov_6.914514_4_plen_187_part_00
MLAQYTPLLCDSLGPARRSPGDIAMQVVSRRCKIHIDRSSCGALRRRRSRPVRQVDDDGACVSAGLHRTVRRAEHAGTKVEYGRHLTSRRDAAGQPTVWWVRRWSRSRQARPWARPPRDRGGRWAGARRSPCRSSCQPAQPCWHQQQPQQQAAARSRAVCAAKFITAYVGACVVRCLSCLRCLAGR